MLFNKINNQKIFCCKKLALFVQHAFNLGMVGQLGAERRLDAQSKSLRQAKRQVLRTCRQAHRVVRPSL